MQDEPLDILKGVSAGTDPWRPLVDRFGRKHTYLRLSLTDRCNFRCRYCMPLHGVEWKPRNEVLSLEECVRLSWIFVKLGVQKIRLTGGEPSVRKGLVGLIRELRALEGLGPLLMTTNGSTLASQAHAYRAAGLTGLNISLDSLQPDRFVEVTRGGDLQKVLAGIDAALDAGYDSVKVNVVAMAGVNDVELVDFVQFGIDKGVHVRFIEFMPFLGNEWTKAGVLPYREMIRLIETQFKLRPLEIDKSAVAKEFQVEGTRASIGFVTSVTDDFCGGCNRIRLTAEGQIKTCLFLKAGTSLRDMMRQGSSDDELAEAIHVALQTKWAGHPAMDQWVGHDDKAMVQIGG